VPLRVVYAAFVLAIARREVRSATQPRLPHPYLRFFRGRSRRSSQPDSTATSNYLAARIKPLVAEKDTALRPAATARQIPAFLSAANQ